MLSRSKAVRAVKPAQVAAIQVVDRGKSVGWKDQLAEQLFRPVHASSLCVFRILYGLCLFMQTSKFSDVFINFSETSILFPYSGLGLFPPVSPHIGNCMLMALGISSITLTLGFFTRTSTIISYVLFAYIFHQCESNHNNHYILMCHVTFTSCFVDWGATLSLDSYLWKRKGKSQGQPTVPYYHVLLMQLLFSIPYFFGFVAKCNYDWLFRAQAPKTWFARRSGFPYNLWWYPWFIVWGGTAYDFAIVFLLYYKPTRYTLAFPGAIFFNCMNKLMFNIGVFPLAMMASLVLFVEPDFPAYMVAVARGKVSESRELMAWCTEVENRQAPDEEDGLAKEGKEGKGSCPRGARALTVRQTLVLVGLGIFVAFHILFPLRHFVLYPDNPSWTEEGHFGSWHMMLRTKVGRVTLELVQEDGKRLMIDPSDDSLINRRQHRKLEKLPHMMIMYAGNLANIFEAAGHKLSAIHAHSCFELNGRPPQQLFIESANLLDYVGTYERIGETAVGKWLQPLASLSEGVPQHALCSEARGTKGDIAVFDKIQKKAGFTLQDDNSLMRVLPDGTARYAYMTT
ncbi:hypothetical protein CYMTET_49841 [Cymbomonas tetramitiformis]|uniref:HTTM-like domain-containing protein n=1 Tax=Cymbomonas tetramitiformis TaxID=36881 RepID=A0AAE0EVE1_9CHLO|nr:hypothetical protein CYMTET_49841 [Cymbomonas tetramitiformis]